MTTNESLDFFLRLVKQKHKHLIDQSEYLMKALSGENLTKKKDVANATLQAATDLRACLAIQDIPSWLNNSIQFITNFVGGSWDGYELLKNFIPQKIAIENHKWTFQDDSKNSFDFDAIFDHYRNESRLPSLFDSIIEILEQIESSGEVDSITMLKSLGKVIATIKRNKDGSYFSLNSAWSFLLSFLNNYMWGELSKIPVLGTALEALSKTIDEANDEMFKVHQQVEEEMKRTVGSEIKALKNKSEFNFIAYDKGGHLLASSTPRLSNTKA